MLVRLSSVLCQVFLISELRRKRMEVEERMFQRKGKDLGEGVKVGGTKER